jgi:tetratricopeptide (TPR) repeat protein
LLQKVKRKHFSIPNDSSLFMKVYGFVLLLCLSLLFISNYSEAQTSPSNQTSTNQTLAYQTTPSNQTSTIQASQSLEQQYFRNGTNLFDQGNYTEAIAYYDKALILNSTDINALYNKALSLDNLGRLDEAVTYYDKVLAISPNDTDSLNNIGLALDGLGEHDKAITYYDRVLAINPEDTDALYNKGLALEELGKKNDAISYYKRVLDVNPSDAAALNKLNLTYNNANNTATTGIQKTDQTLLIYVGVFVVLVISIIVINLVAKRAGRRSESKIITKSDQAKVDQTPYKKSEQETTDDDEWKGV